MACRMEEKGREVEVEVEVEDGRMERRDGRREAPWLGSTQQREKYY